MYTQKKPIDNTHIVRERDRRRNRELLAVLSLGVPIGLFLLLFAWQNLEVIRLGRETTRLQKIYKDTEADHKALEAERDRLTSFDTVETQAARLGFAAADPKTIVMVERQSAVGGRRSAVAPLPLPVIAPVDSSTADRRPPTADSSPSGVR
jgi:hypothetical protein